MRDTLVVSSIVTSERSDVRMKTASCSGPANDDASELRGAAV
jgi:hypothetical protein